MSKEKPSVVIAGAGIAGLAAAQVLIDAGVDVTVLEKSGAAGGKCSSYVDRELGHTIEHGIHGMFPRYANLHALWREAGIDDATFVATDTTGMAGADGRMHATRLADVKGAAPFFLLRMPPPDVFRLRDFVFAASFLARTYAARWRNDLTLDETTFGAMLRASGVSDRMARLLLVPYLRNLSYARGDEVSAQAATTALNFYVVEHADDVKARFFKGGPSATVFEPWRAALEKRGVKFRFKATVQQILVENDRVVGLSTAAIIPDSALGAGDKVWTQALGHHQLALHWDPQKRALRAFDAHCTHMGCPVAADTSTNPACFKCPCHGGVFDVDGKAVKAPPTDPLTEIPMHHDDAASVWVLDETNGSPRPAAAAPGSAVVGADFTILAMDLASTQKILPRELALNPSLAGVPLLRTTDVMVMRLRFAARAEPDRARWNGPDSGVFADADFLDNFFALHTFQPEFAGMPDLFLECHVGDSEAVAPLPDDDVFDRALAVLAAYFPDEDLPARFDRKRSRILRHEDVFPLFAPGDYSRTPTVSDAARPNLMLAGDWVRTDDPEHRSWFMERAAVTGIEAAGAILRALGRPEAARPVVVPESPAISRWVSLPVRAVRGIVETFRRALAIDESG